MNPTAAHLQRRARHLRAPSVDPQGEPKGERRVTRGGCFYCDAVHERAARRNRDLEEHSWRSIGFRIVAMPRREEAFTESSGCGLKVRVGLQAASARRGRPITR